MRTGSLLKNTFVVGSCVFTGVLVLALGISTIATVVFEADWVKTIASKIQGAFSSYGRSDTRIDATDATPPHYFPAERESVRPIDDGSPERRMAELTEKFRREEQPSSPARSRWLELEPVVLELINALMRNSDPGWRELEDEADLVVRKDQILAALQRAEPERESDSAATIERLSSLHVANLVVAMCETEDRTASSEQDPGVEQVDREEPEQDDCGGDPTRAVKLLRSLAAHRRADVFRFLIDLDSMLAACLWSRLSDEVP